jgi:hypothetical protein
LCILAFLKVLANIRCVHIATCWWILGAFMSLHVGKLTWKVQGTVIKSSWAMVMYMVRRQWEGEKKWWPKGLWYLNGGNGDACHHDEV